MQRHETKLNQLHRGLSDSTMWMNCARRLMARAIVALVFGPGLALAAPSPTPDVRRDATVEAVQRVMPAVVNIATEEVVPIRDSLENLFRDFFDPYYR
jgi:hypothetical protein